MISRQKIKILHAIGINVINLPKWNIISKLKVNNGSMFSMFYREVEYVHKDDEQYRNMLFSVLYLNNVPISICVINKKEKYIMGFTNPKHRGKGYAKLVISESLKKLKITRKSPLKFFNMKMGAILAKLGYNLEEKEYIF